jgi:hypothetical protein
MRTMWRRGRRLFSLASILMLLTALAHTAGNLAPVEPTAAEKAVTDAMRGFHLAMGMGMNPSMLDIFEDLTFTMSITFAALAVINLALAASADIADRLLRRIAWINLVWVAAFTWLCWRYRIPPPLISGVLIALPLAGLLLGRPGPEKASP